MSVGLYLYLPHMLAANFPQLLIWGRTENISASIGNMTQQNQLQQHI
jgi:hypothetical protein